MFIKEFIEILLEGGLLILLAAAGMCLFERTQDEEIHEEECECNSVKKTTPFYNFIIEDPDKIKKILWYYNKNRTGLRILWYIQYYLFLQIITVYF